MFPLLLARFKSQPRYRISNRELLLCPVTQQLEWPSIHSQLRSHLRIGAGLGQRNDVNKPPMWTDTLQLLAEARSS